MSSTSHLDTCWRHPSEQTAIDGDEVHVWRIDLNQPESNTRNLSKLLNEDETSRAGRFYFPKHRERFIVARGGLRLILGRYLEADPAKLRFYYSAYGKPSLGGDYSCSELQFNLAHSHEVAVYAFTLRRQIGIDIEYMRSDTSGDEIAERFFAATEVADLLALPPERRMEAFFNCWTRKEAYIKARGEGLSFPLSDFAVSLAPGEPAALLSVLDAPQETSRWSLQELTPGLGYVAAIAVEGRQWRLRHWDGNTLLTTLE